MYVEFVVLCMCACHIGGAYAYDKACRFWKGVYDDGWLCAICTCSYDGDSLYQMKCKHIYHQACLEEWLRYRRNCPLCRRDM